MVSLAFVLSFVVSAVAMLIGIVIFSEITEAMAETLPIILVEIPTTPEVEGLWFLREHCDHAFCQLLGTGGEQGITNYYTHEYKLQVDTVSIFGFNNVVQMTGFGGSPRFTDGNLGKVFDKAELDGKLITWEVQGQTLNSVDPDMILYDGELDPKQSNGTGGLGVLLDDCGIDCFPDGKAVVTSGSGGSIIVINPSIPNDDRVLLQNFTGTPNLSSFDSPTGKVTLVIRQTDANQSTFMGSRHFQVTIEDTGTYRFKSDNPTWSGSSITCTSVNSCTTQSAGLKEESTWSVTSFPPPPLPVFNSEETLNANEVFNNAKNIGFTVIGILPVALFFGLFTVFSGRGVE